MTIAAQFAGETGPYGAVVPVTPAGTELPEGPCRGMLTASACTVSMVDISGNARTGVPLIPGCNPIRAAIISACSGTVFALY